MPKVSIIYERSWTVEADISEEDFAIVANKDNDSGVCSDALNKYLPIELEFDELVSVTVEETLVNKITDENDYEPGDEIFLR